LTRSIDARGRAFSVIVVALLVIALALRLIIVALLIVGTSHTCATKRDVKWNRASFSLDVRPTWASENDLDRQQSAPPGKTDVRCGGSVWLPREHRYSQIVESTGNVRVRHQHVRIAWGRRIRHHDDVHRLCERIDGAANEIARASGVEVCHTMVVLRGGQGWALAPPSPPLWLSI
jgi:hypothetical protein